MTTRQQAQASPAGGSGGSGGQLGNDAIDRLAEVLARITMDRGRKEFEAPTYDGTTDVEMFIMQFTDVAEVNQWPQVSALLHLRRGLKGEAANCGKYETIHRIMAALRARYGITPRQARSKLTNLRRDARTSMQAHSFEVEKLIKVAYQELPEEMRNTMAVDAFVSTVGNGYLQRHLLAVEPRTLEEAVKASNEYLQVSTGSRVPLGSQGAHQLTTEDYEEDFIEEIESTEGPTLRQVQEAAEQMFLHAKDALWRTPEGLPADKPMDEDVWWQIVGMFRKLVDMNERVDATLRSKIKPQSDWIPRCFNCGGSGHYQADCRQPRRRMEGRPPFRPQESRAPMDNWGPTPAEAKKVPTVSPKRNGQSGNANRPQGY